MKDKFISSRIDIVFVISTILFYTPLPIYAQQIATAFQFPTENYLFSISFGFGAANSQRGGRLHLADDVRGRAGATEVSATANGKVVLAREWKNCPNWGYILVIEHTLPDNNKVSTVYAHLDPSSIKVTEGNNVNIGNRGQAPFSFVILGGQRSVNKKECLSRFSCCASQQISNMGQYTGITARTGSNQEFSGT